MNQHFTRLIVCFLLTCGGFTPGFAQTYTLETVPNPKQSQSSHYVSNPDHILSTSAVSQIDAVLGKLEDSTTAQVAVVCINSVGENVPKDFATALFRKWGLGYQQKNNGLLILLVKDQHRIEMETGYGLEGILPDAICRRIQATKMIPLAQTGDFDGAMRAGAEEVAHLISTPEAAQEVYDESKFKSSPKSQPFDNEGVMVLFVFLIPYLLVLRLILFFIRKGNPIADKIEIIISQSKRRLLWAMLLYGIMPVFVGYIVIQLRNDHWLHGWQILFVLYAYPGVVLWDARRRRINTFNQLFGTMTEPERYVRYQAARLNGWTNILLFPIPFWWLKREDEKALSSIRNNARTSAEGYPLTKVEIAHEDAFLTDYQRVEQQVGSVDYDVWRNEAHNINQIAGYENLNNTLYQPCNKCGSKAMYLDKNRIVKEATPECEGQGVHDYACKACGYHKEIQYTIAMSQRSTPSTSQSTTTYSSSGSSISSWGDSSSSSSSSSSWGGGDSGGGGAGSSW